MAIKSGDKTPVHIVAKWKMWAVEFEGEDGTLYLVECDDRDEAFITQKMLGGKVVSATVYCGEWKRVGKSKRA